jgi:ABC-type uncharacterized transport system substrate-binding protein
MCEHRQEDSRSRRISDDFLKQTGLFSKVLALCATALITTFSAPASVAQEMPKRRVVHVDSYHAGNEWNDRIAAAVTNVLEGQGVEVRIIHLDGKRRSSDAEKQDSALRAKRAIEEFKPDVVTASDDDAAKFLLMPHFRDADMPFVFCGLNWDASVYGLPYRNTTGMVEVSPIPQIIQFLRQHSRGPRVGFLAEDTETKRKELLHHERLFGFTYEKTYFVSTFDEWKEAYLRAQHEVDMLLVLGVGAVRGWNIRDAARFVEKVTAIPSGTDFEWLMPVALLGVVKSPEEQGRWAAQAALRILDGVEPNQIPLTYNREGELLFNRRIAERLEIAKPPPLARILP